MEKTGDPMKKVITFRPKTVSLFIVSMLLLPLKPCSAGQTYLLLKNAKIYTMGAGGIIESGMILIKDGKIEKVGKNIDPPVGAQVLDLSGKILIPGMVSASSTLFLSAKDRAFSGEESPDSDILEAADIFDDSVPEVVRDGVSTVYISSASFRVIGGLGAVVKLHFQERGGIEVLKPKAGLSFKLESLDNKKTSSLLRLNQYQGVRDLFIQARDYRDDRQKYEKKLADYQEAQKKEGDKTKLKEPEKPSKDEGKEVLLQAMQKKIPVRIRAHHADSILHALRLGQEFGLKILLEECEDWPMVLPQLSADSLPILSNPLLDYRKNLVPGGAKGYAAGILKIKEDDLFYSGKSWTSVGTPVEPTKPWSALGAAKIPLALIPPEYQPLTARHLRYYASILAAQGLSEIEALKAVTSTPAEILGVSERVGSLEEGKDADLVVLTGKPLNSLSKVESVFINGLKVGER